MLRRSFFRDVVVLGLGCTALPVSAQEESQDDEGRPPNRARRIGVARVTSASLLAIHAELADTRAAVAPTPATPPGHRVEAFVCFVRFARGLRPDAMPVQAMRAALRPAPLDFVWHEASRPISGAGLLGAFGDHSSEPPVQALAADLVGALAPYPALVLHACSCGWADAVGGRYEGPLVIDVAAGEALLVLHAESWSTE